MKPSQFWQNFELGKEIDVACGFVSDGMRNLDEMESLHYEAEIFSVLYNLSVGIERMLKVAVILLEYDTCQDADFEKTLLTHNHMELLRRIRIKNPLQLSGVHHEFLSLLGKFYKSFRYDRFSLSSVMEISKEKQAFLKFLEKYLQIDITEEFPFKFVHNSSRIKRFVARTVRKVVVSIFDVIKTEARSKGLYTYDIRYESKAAKLLLAGRYDFMAEGVLWKELLIFLMNTKASKSPWLRMLRGIEPLKFDPALIPDYLRSFNSNIKSMEVMDELESLYENLEGGQRTRLETIALIGDPAVHLD